MSNLSLPNEGNVSSLEQYYEKRLNRIERALGKVLAAGPTTLQKVDIEAYDGPTENELVIDWPTGKLCWYHDGQWICVPEDPVHAIKAIADKKANPVGPGIFKFDIEKDLADKDVVAVEAFNGTPGSGITTVQIYNNTKGWFMLDTPLTIAGGAKHDNGAAVIADSPRNHVDWKDDIWINVLAAGAGSKGLGVYMTFAIPRLKRTFET